MPESSIFYYLFTSLLHWHATVVRSNITLNLLFYNNLNNYLVTFLNNKAQA
jgi:hypothetical protein